MDKPIVRVSPSSPDVVAIIQVWQSGRDPDAEPWDWEAFVKWDGCTQIRAQGDKHYDRLHIDDMDGFIEILRLIEDTRLTVIPGAE